MTTVGKSHNKEGESKRSTTTIREREKGGKTQEVRKYVEKGRRRNKKESVNGVTRVEGEE